MIILTVFLTTLGLLFIKTNYEVITPAVVTPVDDYMTIGNDKKSKLDINTTSIYGFTRANLLNFIVSKLNPFVDENKLYSYINTSESYETTQGALHRGLSIRNAIVSGYKEAGYDVEIDFKGYVVTSIYNFGVQMNFELEDKIFRVEDIELSEKVTLDDAIKQIRKSNSDKMLFNCLIKRLENNKMVEKEVVLELYLKDDKIYSPIVSELDYDFKILDENAPKYDYEYGNAMGPSGGLMQALFVYESLTGGNLTKGLKIAGTGTVDVNGNAGLIGGIKQKIYTANANGVDIFFVPIDKSRDTKKDRFSNWYDAKEAYDNLLFTNMKIYPVSSLYDIIEYLEKQQ